MKKCPFCAEDIQEEAVKCRYCNEFLDEKVCVSDGVGTPWYFKTSMLVLGFVCVGPFMLPLIWFHPQYSNYKKIILSIILIIVSIILFQMAQKSFKTITQQYETIQQQFN